jgi:NitT/TauT family transport system substrate-binding protein
MKRKSLLFSILILAVLLTACSGAGAAKPTGLTAIKLPVGYVPNVQFAPLYVAIDKGYFKDEGLDVTLDYNMETDSVALLGAGKLQFAIVSGEQVLLGRGKGLPVVYAGAWYNNFPVGVIVDPTKNVTKPADLKGLNIGLPGTYGANYIGLRALLAEGGLTEADVKLNPIGYTQAESFTSKKVDAAAIYVTNEPILLKEKGVDFSLLKVSDYTSLVANGLATNEATIKDHPELVRGMVKAMLRGIDDANKDPDGAYEICKKYIENLDKADTTVQKAVLNASIEYWKNDKPGFTSLEAWQNMQKLLMDMGLLQKELDLTKAFTNEYLPAK